MNKYTFTCSKWAFISPYFFHKTLLAFLFLVTTLKTFGVWGQTLSDNATNSAYSGGWNNGTNGGTGFNAWSLSSDGANAGHFKGDPAGNGMGTIGIGTAAFGMYGHSSQYAYALRNFSSSMGVGDVLTFYWSMNWDCGSTGSKGWELKSGSTIVFSATNTNSSTITYGGVASGTISANYGNSSMLVTVTRTSSTQYSVSITRRNTADGTFSTNITSSSAIDNIRIYIGGQQSTDGQRNMFFNNFQIQKPDQYRSAASGNWGTAGTWEISTNGGSTWSAAGAAPGSTMYSTVTIRNTHTVSQNQNYSSGSNNNIVVESGGTLNMTGATGTFQFSTMSVSGTVSRNNASHAYSGAITINNGGKYVHAVNGGSVPTCTWSSGSTFEVTGVTSAVDFSSGSVQNYHHIVWNCTAQTSIFSFGGLTTINGNLTVQSTGATPSASSGLYFTNSTPLTSTISGNLTVSGGFFAPFGSATTNSSTLNISGNLSISGGTFDIYRPSTNTGTINLTGDFSMSGGTLTKGGAGTGNFNFSKSGTQTYDKSSGTISGAINFAVNNGSTLSMGTNVLDGSTGTFTLSSGAGLETGNTSGIASTGATGSIQVGGTRTYNTGANYTFNGSSAQATGVGFTGANNLTINNSAGVTLSGNASLAGTLTLTSGAFTVGSGNTVTINNGGSVFSTSGSLASGTGAGTFTFSGTGSVTGTVGFNNVNIAGAVNFGTAATVNGTLTINAGGWITTNAPLYGPNSLLKYNTGNPANNPYGRGFEWSTTSGAGYPNDVQISNNTSIDYPNSSGSFTTNIGLARDLIIDAGSSLYMDYGSGAASGKLFVGRSVNIAGDLSLGDAIGGDIYVGGDWTRTSGSFNANNRAVFFTGTTGNQTITNASGESFPFVLVDKASGDLVLNNNVTISGGLTLTNGLVDIGNNNVDLLSSTLAGGSPTSYVRTSGTGECRRNLAVGATVLFPVGRSTYNPVELVKSGTQHKFGVRVLDVVTANGQDNGPASTGPNVGRMWDITPAAAYTASNGAVSVNLVYANNLGYFMNGFVNNQPADRRMFHFGPAWVDITGVTGTFESGNYSITNYTYCRQPGVTDFSPFTITNFGAVLPIELVSFQANCKEDNSVSVTWTTASEYNTSHYVVEKSRDGINWSVLGQTAAAGNSTQLLNYEMIDIEKAPGTSYYRLTQFDNDGVFEMFDPVSVNCNGTPSNNHITTYPNPSLDGFYVSLFTETMEGNGQLTITDASGRPVYGKSVNIQDGNNVFHIGDMNAASGMYYIQVSNGTNSTDIVKHSLR